MFIKTNSKTFIAGCKYEIFGKVETIACTTRDG